MLEKDCPICHGKGRIHDGWMMCTRCRGSGKVKIKKFKGCV